MGSEGPERKPAFYLVFDYPELFLVFMGRNTGERLWNLRLDKGYNPFVLEVGTERHFDETFVGSDSQNQVVVIELSLELIVAVHIEENRGIFRQICEED